MRATDRRTALLLALTLALSQRERGWASRCSEWSNFVPNSIGHAVRGAHPPVWCRCRGNPLWLPFLSKMGLTSSHFTLEHIIPRALGGADTEENPWLSCRLCNETKGVQIEATDPDTKAMAPLCNPRTDQWGEHFGWSEEGTRLLGRTVTGRATIAALSLNSELRVRSRAIWVEVGYHPPK
jgi:hypothetical protein